jgi:predicted dehydrogenase
LAGQPAETVATERGAYPTFYEGVADAVRGDGPAPVDPHDALDVVRIIEEAHRLQ